MTNPTLLLQLQRLHSALGAVIIELEKDSIVEEIVDMNDAWRQEMESEFGKLRPGTLAGREDAEPIKFDADASGAEREQRKVEVTQDVAPIAAPWRQEVDEDALEKKRQAMIEKRRSDRGEEAPAAPATLQQDMPSHAGLPRPRTVSLETLRSEPRD